MKKLIFFTFLYFFYSSCSKALEIIPLKPIPGAPVLLREIPKDVSQVNFLGKTFPLFSWRKERVALIAIPLSSSSGYYKITLKGKQRYIYSFRVYAKKYPREYLTVPENMIHYSPILLARIKREIKCIKGIVSKYHSYCYLNGPFIWPANGRISSPFGLQRFFNNEPRSPHGGIDIALPKGSPVRAANRGLVVLTADFYLPGKVVILDHGQGIYSFYAHLSKFCVKQGEVVSKGQVIALSGDSGRVTGPHLHFGCYIRGIKVDPALLIRILEDK